MIDTIRNLAIDWQDWSSNQDLSYGELAQWQENIRGLAETAAPSGELLNELKENGVL